MSALLGAGFLVAASITVCRVAAHNIYVDDLPEQQYKELGDINIGVLLPVHGYDVSNFCGSKIQDMSLLQRMEALAFTFREINERTDILPEHKLGFIMFDDCYKDTTALAQTLHFIGKERDENCEMSVPGPEQCGNNSLTLYDIVGLIGSETSTTTTQIANLYTSLKLPQVSYLATTPALRNRYRYDHFYRTLPSDNVQAKVIVSLLAHFNWSYVSVIYSEGDYGNEGYDALQKEAINHDICFAEVFEIKHTDSVRNYKTIIHRILMETKARVVVVFAEPKIAMDLMRLARFVDGRITWVASEAWAKHLDDLQDYKSDLLGALSVNIHTTRVHRFERYFQELGPSNLTGNPWIHEFWERYFECTTNPQRFHLFTECAPDLVFACHAHYYPDPSVPLAMDAVYTFAHGLHDAMYSAQCAYAFTKEERARCAARHLGEYIKHVQFEGESGPVQFDEFGEVQREYWIQNIAHDEELNTYTFRNVAVWNQSSDTRMLHMTSPHIQWSEGFQPQSLCSSRCGKGEKQVVQQKRCCWVCVPCRDNQYTSMWFHLQRCYNCSKRMWPDEETRTQCLDVIPLYLQWHDDMGIVLASLATTGLVSCLFTAIIFTININNPLIKASSRELSYLLLTGLIISYSFMFLFLLKPSPAVCSLRQLGFSLCFSLMYGPLVTKTIRIYRIFDAGRRMDRRPACVGCKSQMGIAISIIVIHAIIIVGWTLLDKPKAYELYPDTKSPELICHFPMGPFVTSIVYNAVLLIASVYSAFRTRKLPDNFNESKFIGFCVYSTVVIQLAFIPAYFAVGKAFYEVMFLSLSVFATATLILLCIFAPKIYALYLVEQEYLHVSPKFTNKNGSRRLVDDNSAIHKSYGNLREEARAVMAAVRTLPAPPVAPTTVSTSNSDETVTKESELECNGAVQLQVLPAPGSTLKPNV